MQNKTMKKVLESKKLFASSLAIIFLIMLLFNFLTLLCVDDYAYSFSFATGKRITNILDIFPSMYEHAFTMNGRLIAHFFVQLSLLFPKYIFNFVNAGMLVLELVLIYKISNYHKKRNVLVFFAIACLVWYLVPVFGQTNLWLDGSCNYLWGITFILLFILPYYKLYTDSHMESKIRYLMPVFGLMIGAYSENHSLAAIICVLSFILLVKFYKKEKLPGWSVISVLMSIFGYIIMLFMPANLFRLSKFENSHSLNTYALRFIKAMDMMSEKLGVLCVAWLILLVVSIYYKRDKNRIIASCIFVLTSLASNFAMIASPYSPERSMLGCTVFLIIGCMILACELMQTKYEMYLMCVAAILIYSSTIQFVKGGYDIATTYKATKLREKYIISQRLQGNMDVKVNVIKPMTKYSAVYGLKDLDTKDPSSWPNNAIAAINGVNSISVNVD